MASRKLHRPTGNHLQVAAAESTYGRRFLAPNPNYPQAAAAEMPLTCSEPQPSPSHRCREHSRPRLPGPGPHRLRSQTGGFLGCLDNKLAGIGLILERAIVHTARFNSACRTFLHHRETEGTSPGCTGTWVFERPAMPLCRQYELVRTGSET